MVPASKNFFFVKTRKVISLMIRAFQLLKTRLHTKVLRETFGAVLVHQARPSFHPPEMVCLDRFTSDILA